MLRIPIAHGEGNYFADPTVIAELESSRRVIFRYCDAGGQITDDANPNGAVNGIAGICSAGRNVVGLMPHPERACESVLGSADGLVLFESVLSQVAAHGAVSHGRVMSPVDAAVLSNVTVSPSRNTTASSRPSAASRRITELGIFSVMWSEHCSYKSSRIT